MKLLLVDNRTEYVVTHRRPLIEAARRAGYDVHVAALTPGSPDEIVAAGFAFHSLASRRGASRLLQEVSVLFRLRALLGELQPDLCHFITLRAVFHGLLALVTTRRLSVPIVCSVTGLGYLFTDDGLKSRFGRAVAGGLIGLLRRFLRPVFIFQNNDDRNLFAAKGWVPLEASRLIRGSGVDIHAYRPSGLPLGSPIVLFCARYLHHKGIIEFVEAARLLRGQGVEARFLLAGGVDPDNPASVSREDVNAWVAEGVVEDCGHCSDMPERFKAASLVVLPSYREGLPKVVIEAASAGRAVVTTDVPGCREAVIHGETGLIVPARDAVSLAEAIRTLIADPARLRAMGDAARLDAERRFSSQSIAAAILEVYSSVKGHVT